MDFRDGWLLIYPVYREEIRARNQSEAVGTQMQFLQPCCSDFNSVENALTWLKTLTREAGGRTAVGPRQSIGRSLNAFGTTERAKDFPACGYDPERSDATPVATASAGAFGRDLPPRKAPP